MTKKGTSIQINGKRYDALSGALMAFEETPVTGRQHSAKSIDGVIGGASSSKPTVMTKTPAKHVSRPRPTGTTRTPAKHAAAKRPNSSKTLMRHTVSKPAPSAKRQLKTQSPNKASAVTKPTLATVTAKTSLHRVDSKRAARASAVVAHPRVSHFHQELSAVAAVVRDDIQQAVHAIDQAIIIPDTAVSPSYVPDIRQVRIVTDQQTTSDIFEQALRRATSHEEAPVELPKGRLKSLRRRMVSFTAGAVAVLAIVGIFGFHQQDARQFRSAARQAGVSAKMPGYQPNGYALQQVKASGGYLYAKYSSADKHYIVSERQSSWGNDELAERIGLGDATSNFSALKAEGKTVYIYGNNQAAWVHEGVLYQVLGNGVLSSQDFTQIASSL